MKQTPLYVNIESESDLVYLPITEAVEDFGRDVLNRKFDILPFPEEFPQIRDYERNGKIMIDSYRQMLWEFMNQNKDKPIFTVDVTNSPLVPERFYDKVLASSVRYMDLETGKLLLPDKVGVIVSRDSFDPSADDGYNQARAYFLTNHEIGHLALGTEVCESDNCVFSHSIDLDNVVKHFWKTHRLPVCDLDKKRIKEFREKWRLS